VPECGFFAVAFFLKMQIVLYFWKRGWYNEAMRSIKSKSVFIRYLTSYAFIVFLAVLLLGVMIFIFSLNQIIQININTTRNKLDFIASDLQLQLDIMQDIAQDVCVNIYYKPVYFLRNKYYEIELLDNFSKYVTYSPLIDEYFLYYQGEPYLYRGNGGALSPGVFLEMVTGKQEEGYWDRISGASETLLFFVPGRDENFLFVIFPVNIITSSQNSAVNGVLVGFVVREDTLRKRLAALSGLEHIPLVLLFKDKFLCSLPGNVNNQDSASLLLGLYQSGNMKKVLRSGSPEGAFEILTSRERIEENDLIHGYRNTLILVIAVIITALSGTGIYLAYRNYKPIKQLESSIYEDMPEKEHTADELKNIEKVFRKIRQEEFKSHRLIQGQLNNLRRQMADIILEGGYNNAVQSRAWEMGIVLEGPYYSILAAGIDKDPSGKYEEADIWNIIENIQYSDVTVYCGNLGADSTVGLLLDLYEDPSRRDPAVRSLYQECKNRGLNLHIGVGPVIKNFLRISEALLKAHEALQKGIAGGVGITYNEGDEPPWILKGEHWMEHLTGALKKRDTGEVSSVLKEITFCLTTRKSSVIYQRYIYYNVLSAMVNLARDMKVNIRQERISDVLKAGSPEDFERNALSISEHICTAGPVQINDVMRPIMEYIHSHCCDYEMSLEMLREQFGCNITKLSQMIKEYTGETFRAYVTNLRMEKAKDLLKARLTIAEISSQVGYGSVSHFLKTFRSFFGHKPSFYREHYREQPNSLPDP
jgi:AraC-like DNA-binding protein